MEYWNGPFSTVGLWRNRVELFTSLSEMQHQQIFLHMCEWTGVEFEMSLHNEFRVNMCVFDVEKLTRRQEI